MRQQILVVGEVTRENPEMVNILRREPDWKISQVPSAEEAITLFYAKPFDVIVLGKKINMTDKQKLRAILSHCSFENIVIDQKVDNVELLKKEIRDLMSGKKIEKLRRIHVSDSLNPINQADKIRLVPFER